jgi:TatD DNase family protein
MLIDTHAHLDFPDFAPDLEDVIARATDAGVTTIVAMSTRLETAAGAIRLAEKFPNVWAAVGIHPLEVGDAPPDTIDQLRKLEKHPRVVCIGEIGLDYFNLDADPSRAAATKARQAELFQQQLELAAELGRNVVLHLREQFYPELWADSLRILKPFTGRLRAVCHCFKGKPEQVTELTDMGHLVSFTGFVTYPEMPQISATAAAIASSAFMLETDCPFMRPPPDTEGRCEPAFLRQIAEHVAQLRGVSVEALAEETSATARAFFGLPPEAGVPPPLV